VTLTATEQDNGQGIVVVLNASTDYPMGAGDWLVIYEPQYGNTNQIVANVQAASTASVTVTPRAEVGNYVAVVVSGAPPGLFSAAVPLAQQLNPLPPTQPWTVRMVTPTRAQTNYRYGVGATTKSDAQVVLYDLLDPTPAISYVGWCGSTTQGPGYQCDQTITPLLGCDRIVPVVTNLFVNHLYPEPANTYDIGERFACPPPPDPSSLISCPVCDAADPVNTATGTFKESFLDVSVPGRGAGLQLGRSYSTANVTRDGWFGWGWASTYETRLKIESLDGVAGGVERATFTDPGGSSELFYQVPGGAFVTRGGVYGGLVKTGTGASATYRLSDWRARMAWGFDNTGRLTSVTDRNGETTTLTYGATTVTVTALTEGAGRTLTITFTGTPGSPGSHVTSVATPMNRINLYTYEADGDLATSQEIGKVTSTFTYGTAALGTNHMMLTRANTASVVVMTNEYTAGRVTKQSVLKSKTASAKPVVTTFDYGTGNQGNATGATTTVTESVPTTVTGTGLTQVAKTSYAYVNMQAMSVTTDPGTAAAATTSFVRDPLTTLPTSFTNAMNKVTTFEYDTLGNVTKVTDPLGRITQSTYDAWSQLTCVVGPVRYAAGVSCPTGGGALPLGAAGWTYNAAGNLTSWTDARGNTTTYAHGNASHPQDVTSMTDAEQRVFTYTYDAYGNPNSTTATPSAGVTLTSRAVYNPDSQLTCTVSPRQVAALVQCPAATVTTFPLGAQGTVYDAAKATVSSSVNAKGATTTYGYDTDNNLTTVTQPITTTTPTTTTTTVYDHAHRPTTSTEATGTTSALLNTTVYDIPAIAGGTCNLTTVPNAASCVTSTDNAAKITTYYYTSRGQLAGLNVPGNSLKRTTFRKDGLPDVVTLFGGRTLTNAYNDAGALTSVTSSVAGTTPVSFTYRADGLRATMNDASGATTYDYFDHGLLKSVANSSGTTSYTWDQSNRLETLTYPSGRVVTRNYDGVGRFASVADGAGHTTVFDLDEDGLVKQTNYPNGNRAAVTRDQVGGILTTNLTNAANASLAGLTWTRTPTSLVKTETGTGALAGTDTYDYDPALRMKTAGGSTYTFDTGNHPLAIGGPSVTYNTNGSGRLATRVSGGQTRTFTYTDGNLTANAVTAGTGTGYAYGWNGLNQMTSATVTPSGGVATTHNYSYDGDNLRLSRTTAGTTTRFSYDQSSGLPQLIREGTIEYIYGPEGLPVEQINTDNTGALYYTRDQHGDTRVLADSTGAVAAAYKHTPYGVSTKLSGTASTTMLYGAGHTDTETGLIYLINRYYDPTTANFTSPDPLLEVTGTPYAYGGNSPLNGLDPLGLCWGPDFVCETAEQVWVEATDHVGGCADQDLSECGELFLDAFSAGQIESTVDDASGCADHDLASCGWLFVDVASLGIGKVVTCPLRAGIRAERAAIEAAEAEARALKQLDNVCNCFVAGTTVKTADGDKTIEDIKVGDRVWAKNLDTGKNELKTVTGLFNKHTDTVMTITVADGAQVTVTQEHPFYVTGEGWVMSGDLRMGDDLAQRDGSTTQITDITTQPTDTTVYNFTVAGNHNYYVTNAQLLVHNCPDRGPKTGAGRSELPSWYSESGYAPEPGETPAQAAKRIMDAYSDGARYRTGPTSDYNRIKKYISRRRK
jgi:RHS repeat-associated protein